MSFQYNAFESVAGIEPERALNIGVGVAQAPLWAAFYASAGLGAAWWWSTAWTRGAPAFDFQKLIAPEPQTAAEAYIEALDDAVCDLIETSHEDAVDTVELAEAVEESVELAQDVAVEGLRDAQDEFQDAVIEAIHTEASVEPLAFAAAEDEAADLAAVELASEAVAEEPVAEPSAPKASKKKAPKAEA